jgi:glucosamine--fructose-6-phosphate aminotransferase (isomerizing)
MTTTDLPAALMGAEIREQPAVWRRLLASDQFGAAAAQVRRRRPTMVLLAARGTSDHAALYAKYLVEVTHQLPAGWSPPRR